MKYTDEQHAEKLAEMCVAHGLVGIVHTKYDEYPLCPAGEARKMFCPISLSCIDMTSDIWLAYLRRWPGLHGQKRGDL